MNIFILILFFKLFTNIHVEAALETTPSKPSILPLVMIKVSTETMLRPDHIITAISNEVGDFTAGTIFKTWQPGNQLFFCGEEPSSDDLSDESNETLRCSYPTNFVSGQTLRCDTEPQLFVEKVVETNDDGATSNQHCGPDLKGQMYRFAYEGCTTHLNWLGWRGTTMERYIMELYQFCFIEEENKTLYTEHTIQSLRLLSDYRLQREREYDYEIFADKYNIFESDLEATKTLYIELENKNKLGHRIEPSTADSPLTPQKLVPSDDMPFAVWRKPTFHLLNMNVMQKAQKKLWDHISQVIRQDAIKKDKEYKITTAALNLPLNKDEPIADQIPKPDIWIKIIRYTEAINASLAIIMNTNLDEQTFESIFENTNCKENSCSASIYDEFPEMSKSIRCCVARDNPLLDYLNLQDEMKADGFMKIETLTKSHSEENNTVPS